jgi:3-hydroxybutyryl-CoA dehydrogenase
MEIRRIFVAGAGLMGGGISQVCAQAGYDVVMRDLTQEAVDAGVENIRWSVTKLVKKSMVEGSVDEIMGRVRPVTDLSAAADADFVFEAIFEDQEAKSRLFSELDEICSAQAIFASNTSAIPITNMAAATRRASKVVGTHFFSPVPMMKIVEIVAGERTSSETVDTAENLLKSLGKETLRVNRDVAGFALNRISFPSTVEAIELVEAGVVSVEDVDKGMRLAFGRPMGPFETVDLAGLDVALGALNAVYKETGDEKFHPPMLLQRKVERGQLGRKTGVGWYRYDKKGNKIGPVDQ